MKIVVTGGAGFTGSHLCDFLLRRGDEVTIIDDFSTGRKENIKHLEGRIELVENTILNTDLLRDIFKGKDAVLHQAALPSVPVSIERPQDANEVSISGTLSVFVAARDANVERVVYASSSSVYGDTPVLPKVETMPSKPLSPYAIQKMVAELYAKKFYDLYGLKTIGLRYFNVFGPRQNPNSQYAAVIPKLISMMKDGESPIINGDGKHARDFTYISNVVDANIAALHSEKGFGEVFNAAVGSQSLNGLVKDINKILGTNIEAKHGPERAGDIKDSLADISMAKDTLGYKPSVTFEEGLRLTIDSL